jgi:hypothetical protein
LSKVKHALNYRREEAMRAIRDIIKVTFWSVVLSLSLAWVAMAETSATTTEQPGDRKGGQAGIEVHSEKRSATTETTRMGGQAGQEPALEERTTKYGSVGGKRVGGQAGKESDQKGAKSKAK